MPITPADVRPGIAVFLEPRVLRADPRTVIRVQNPKSIVDTQHYFICLRTAGYDLGLWIPCFSRQTTGRVLIPREVKFGHPTWANAFSYHYRNQAWTFTHEAAANASSDDLAAPPQLNGIHPEAAAHIERLLNVVGTQMIQGDKFVGRHKPPHRSESPANSPAPSDKIILTPDPSPAPEIAHGSDAPIITAPSADAPSPSASPPRTEPC